MKNLTKRISQNSSSFLVLITFQILLVFSFSGCVSIPSEPVSESITSTELHDHVAFLAQPALKGRKPRTSGSKLARKYINDKFEALNLSPWGESESFNQKFFMGTNIVGVLHGSDPNLCNEYIIVVAHYDHVGKTKDGMCLGASDNASGVSAMLEIAEQMALSENKPRRSICFAAFDSEEMFTLGSLEFTCRDDFDSSKIAGMVNIDMLGRAGFEVLDNQLFLVGTNPFKSLRKQIQQANSTNLDLVPIGTDIVGPRGDHIAFENMGFPALFFTCSLHKDYHMPTDTIDKLDFYMILKSAEIIYNTVEILANLDERFLAHVEDKPDIEELEAVDSLLSSFLVDPNALGLSQSDANSLVLCKEMADNYLNDKQAYTKQKRIALATNISEVALSYELNRSKSSNILNTFPSALFSRELIYFPIVYRAEIVEAGREIVKHLNQHKPGLFNEIPEFKYELKELPDSHIALMELENGQYQLDYYNLNGDIRLEKDGLSGNLRRHFSLFNRMFKNIFSKKKKLPKSNIASRIITIHNLNTSMSLLVNMKPVEITINSNWEEITGTREDIIDAMLLQFRTWTKIENKVMEYVTGHEGPQSNKEWIEWRCKGGLENELKWKKDCLKSENPYVLFYIFQRISDSDQKLDFVCNIIRDTNKQAWLRERLIYVITQSDKKGLLTLVDMLLDETHLESRETLLSEDHPMKYLEESYSFSRQNLKSIFRMNESEKHTPESISDKALERLKNLTKEDFGMDQDAWKSWIEANVN